LALSFLSDDWQVRIQTGPEFLGTVDAVFNSQCGQGENDVSAYKAVYGQKLDHPLSCSKAEARRCWTVNDRMLVTNEPKFDTYCKENYILEDEVNEVTDNDDLDDSGYFSEDDLPVKRRWMKYPMNGL
jgi:hypothetical protein